MSSPLSRRVIGIAVGESQWELAEVVAAGRGCRTVKTSQFTPPGNWTTQTTACGEALAAHLKTEGYRSGPLAFGLGNRHLFARRRQLPAAPSEAARRGILRLAIEKEHPDRRLAFDYLDIKGSTDNSADALLIGVNDRLLSQLREVTKAARRKLAAVTTTALARAAAGTDAAEANPSSIWLQLDDDGFDLVETADRQVVMLGRVSLHGRSAAEAFENYRRQQQTATDAIPPILVTHDSSATSATQQFVEGMNGRVNVRDAEGEPAAESIAKASLTHSDSFVNFTSSRLAAERSPTGGQYRRPAILTALALLAVIVGVAAWGIIGSQKNQELRTQYEQVEPLAEALQSLREQTAAVAPWFTERPRTISALGTLTECFPREGRVWVTSLRLRDSGEGSLQGRADSKPTMLACLQAMQANASLAQVQLRDWNQADRSSGTVQFEIVFVHRPAGGSS